MLRTSRFIAIATTSSVVALLIVCLSACAPRGPEGPRKATNWAYAPTSITVHPLSRFKNPSDASDGRMIVVHVEFVDGDGFACRGVGTLLVTITDEQQRPLVSESVDLENPDINRLRFDAVTRTYRVHFDQLPEQCVKAHIRATFSAEDQSPIVSKWFTIISHPTK